MLSGAGSPWSSLVKGDQKHGQPNGNMKCWHACVASKYLVDYKHKKPLGPILLFLSMNIKSSLDNKLGSKLALQVIDGVIK